MKIQDVEITSLQIETALAAMKGTFAKHQVTSALVWAGVPRKGYVADKAADSLLLQERQAGRILAITHKTWQRCEMTSPV